MSTYQNLVAQSKDGIFYITVNRPDKLNALNRQTVQEIGQAVKQANADKSVTGIIITGSGAKAFVAGADIKEFNGLTGAEGKTMASEGHMVFQSIEDSPKPVIAAVNGFALGGGCDSLSMNDNSPMRSPGSSL